jgi:2-amino-4-hydroxy-6-hydroxymethyldihydropteridine diphosphokinase
MLEEEIVTEEAILESLEVKKAQIHKDGHICYLGLGSNMNDPKSQLLKAIGLLRSSNLLSVFAVSKFYFSKPYGPVQDQDDFVNAVVGIKTFNSPFAILLLCNAIEAALGRVREVHWGPRVIDLDVLLFGDMEVNASRLTIPHKDMYNRDFVLRPLAEIKI